MRIDLRPPPAALGVVALILSVSIACKATPAKSPTPTRTAAPTTATPASAPIVPHNQTPVRGGTASSAPSTTVGAVVGTPGLVTITAAGALPQTISVQSGRSVTWQNADSTPHQIVSDETGLFATGPIPPGGSAVIPMSALGIHDWHDTASAAIKGTVRVLQ